ncbi:hypothetical protein PGTUg99_023549 [Puccinia graminis f. sp. tritici]|uniref:Uncharacterized protein n=1 Tax=Puccinia graminis f. sp. tritici TaxID=56615 RepID=A0A5B0S6A0_PUCGR|nr:hypothetical protein PGTUg99_023549 [Puccinia graminis f. sp. tritici]
MANTRSNSKCKRPKNVPDSDETSSANSSTDEPEVAIEHINTDQIEATKNPSQPEISATT